MHGYFTSLLFVEAFEFFFKPELLNCECKVYFLFNLLGLTFPSSGFFVLYSFYFVMSQSNILNIFLFVHCKYLICFLRSKCFFVKCNLTNRQVWCICIMRKNISNITKEKKRRFFFFKVFQIKTPTKFLTILYCKFLTILYCCATINSNESNY